MDDFGVKESQIKLIIPFSTIQPEEMPLEQNIVFIGSKFVSQYVTPLILFLQKKPNRRQREEFLNALNYLKENPYAEFAEFIDKQIIRDGLVAKHFDIGFERMQLSDEKRIAVLSAVADFGLTLYGTSNWTEFQFYNSNLLLSYSTKRVMTIAENAAAYNSSKIGISVGHLQAVEGFPWRTLDIMRSNACLVSDYHKDFEKFFPKNLFPVYKDAYEAREICKELLIDESKRRKIVIECQEFTFENFSFDKVAENVNDLLGCSIL